MYRLHICICSRNYCLYSQCCNGCLHFILLWLHRGSARRKKSHAYLRFYGGPSKAEPFFQQLADPKTALQSLTEMHLSMFKKEECHCSRPLAPLISMLLEAAAKKPSSKQKGPLTSEKPIRVHNTEIRRGAGRPVIQTDLHYNVSPSLLKHCLIVIQSVQAPSARIFPKPGKGGQFQSCGREINEEWAFTHMEVMAGQM